MLGIHGVVYEDECPAIWMGQGGAIHSALIRAGIQVALICPPSVGMVEIVAVGKCNSRRLRKTGWGRLVKPVARLYVVLRAIWVCAAGKIRAKSIKEIVRGAIFLKDHDDVLEVGDLGIRGYHCEAGN